MTKYEYVKSIVDANDDCVISGHTRNVDGIEELQGDYDRLNVDEENEKE